MAIRKSKSNSIDIDKMFSNVDTNEQIQKETEEANEYLNKIHSAQATLRAHAEKLCECVEAERKITAALDAASNSCDNIVSGICNAIVAAQHNTVFKTKVEPEHLGQLQNIVNDTIVKEKAMLAEHRAKQAKMFAKHESKILKILQQNEGVWFSNFWAKVTYSIAIACCLLSILYVHFGK